MIQALGCLWFIINIQQEIYVVIQALESLWFIISIQQGIYVVKQALESLWFINKCPTRDICSDTGS
jgi:hypothetical protein